MARERTLSMIKPDAVTANKIGAILERFEKNGFTIISCKMIRLTTTEAEGFYEVHRQKPFYNDLVKFMTSAPVLVQVLEADDAVAKNRTLMGATDSRQAAAGTIRADFGKDVEKNAVHGSDSLENARREIGFFFSEKELLQRTEEHVD